MTCGKEHKTRKRRLKKKKKPKVQWHLSELIKANPHHLDEVKIDSSSLAFLAPELQQSKYRVCDGF